MQAGSDIESICSKCGDSPHVVVAMVDGRIAKVQCLRCDGRHRYRHPAAEAGSVRSKSSSARKKVATGPLVEADLSLPVESYRASASFAPGARIKHIQFGEGVVEKIAGPTKIQVYFPTGSRILVHQKSS